MQRFLRSGHARAVLPKERDPPDLKNLKRIRILIAVCLVVVAVWQFGLVPDDGLSSQTSAQEGWGSFLKHRELDNEHACDIDDDVECLRNVNVQRLPAGEETRRLRSRFTSHETSPWSPKPVWAFRVMQYNLRAWTDSKASRQSLVIETALYQADVVGVQHISIQQFEYFSARLGHLGFNSSFSSPSTIGQDGRHPVASAGVAAFWKTSVLRVTETASSDHSDLPGDSAKDPGGCHSLLLRMELLEENTRHSQLFVIVSNLDQDASSTNRKTSIRLQASMLLNYVYFWASKHSSAELASVEHPFMILASVPITSSEPSQLSSIGQSDGQKFFSAYRVVLGKEVAHASNPATKQHAGPPGYIWFSSGPAQALSVLLPPTTSDQQQSGSRMQLPRARNDHDRLVSMGSQLVDFTLEHEHELPIGQHASASFSNIGETHDSNATRKVNARPSKPVNPFEGGYTQDNVLAPLGEGNAQQKLMADLSRLDSACIDMDGVLVHDSGMKHLLECLSGSVDADSKLRTPARSEQSIVQFASESDWKKLLELRPSREEVSECAGSWRAGRGLREQEAWKALTLKLQKLGAKVWLLSSQPSLLIHAISSRLGLKDQVRNISLYVPAAAAQC